MSDLLKLRKQMKAKKPTFLRQDVRIKKSLDEKWRKPQGGQSKLRRKFGGKRPFPSQGYRSPAKVRGLTPEGFEHIVVNTVSELKGLKAATIGSKVGAKKTIAILEEAKKLGIQILNIKNAEKFTKAAKERIEKNKARLKARKTKKEAAKPKEKKETKKEVSAEDQKKQQNEEKKKLIEGKSQ